MSRPVKSANLPSTLFVLALVANAVAIGMIGDIAIRVVLSVCVGLLLVGALEAVHQATHNNLFSAPWANRLVGTALALPLLLNFVRYRAFHAHHHAHTATPNDPERALYLDQSATSIRSLVLAPLFHLGFARTIDRSGYVALRLRRSATDNRALLVVFISAVLGATAYDPRTMVLLYWGPLALFTWFDFLLNQAEHYGMRELQAGEDPGQATNNLLLPRLLAVMFLYRNLHRVHHIAPRTPWHRSEAVFREQDDAGMAFWPFLRRYVNEGPRLWGVR